MNAEELILKAKVKLQKEQPFFSYILTYMHTQEKEEVKTMGVDKAGNLYYNTEFVEKTLTFEQLKGVLTHEAMHTALQHLDRLGTKEALLWNIATDITINNIVKKSGLELPEGALIPYNNAIEIGSVEITDIENKTANEIYNILDDKVKENEQKQLDKERFDKHLQGEDNKQGQGQDGNETRTGQEINGTGKTGTDWKRVLIEAHNHSKMQGKTPSGLKRILEEVIAPKEDWRTLLYRYITNQIPYDTTYNRPNKRSISTGVYMPDNLKETIEIMVSVDTSGSISQKELSEFLEQTISIARSFHNVELTLIECDCAIQQVMKMQNGNIEKIRKMEVKGGGGTSHKPIYEWIAENKPSTKLVINFTDGYTEFPKETPSTDTLWVITRNGVEKDYIPFGKVIKCT